MNTTIDALKALYVAIGGSAETVANFVTIPDMVNAIATQTATLVLAAELPDAPAANGTYNLQCVKSSGGATYKWPSAG